VTKIVTNFLKNWFELTIILKIPLPDSCSPFDTATYNPRCHKVTIEPSEVVAECPVVDPSQTKERLLRVQGSSTFQTAVVKNHLG
jgi:hypothetical protein